MPDVIYPQPNSPDIFSTAYDRFSGFSSSAMGLVPNRLDANISSFDPAVMDGIAERLWKKMFDFPVLVVCAYCESVNAVTNGTCFHCNGPLGDARKYAP